MQAIKMILICTLYKSVRNNMSTTYVPLSTSPDYSYHGLKVDRHCFKRVSLKLFDLQRYPTDTALGLEYIHEWSDGHRPGLKWYTCSLQGCKSAWGKSYEMAAHLIGGRMKHSRHYLNSIGFPDALNLTQDKLLVGSSP